MRNSCSAPLLPPPSSPPSTMTHRRPFGSSFLLLLLATQSPTAAASALPYRLPLASAVLPLASTSTAARRRVKRKKKKAAPTSSASSSNDDAVIDDSARLEPPLSAPPNAKRSGKKGSEDKMPCLFGPDELQYDRYAAALAATEPLRRRRDEQTQNKKKGGGKGGSSVVPSASNSFFGRARRNLGSAIAGPSSSGSGSKAKNKKTEQLSRADAAYVLDSTKVLGALGLTVGQFNQLGREVGNDPTLKERVMEQAYLYKMAATVNMDRIPLLEDPGSERLLKAHKRRRVQMFARSMQEIEELRHEQTERLRRALNLDRLPDGVRLTDPALRPILDPKVRAVCDAFPLQAEEIVKKYGLNSEEFNKMLEETKGNPIFRWRVKKYMGKSIEEKNF